MAEEAPSPKIYDLTNIGKIVDQIVVSMQALSEAATKVLVILQEIDNEEIKLIHQVEAAPHNLVLAVEEAYALLNKVNDVVYHCQSNSTAAAIEGLSCSPPNLIHMHDLMGSLGRRLTMAENKYSEFAKVGNTVTQSFGAAAKVCVGMARESQNREQATSCRGISRAAVGTAVNVTTGVALSALAGVFTFGIGTIVGLSITGAAVGAAGVVAGVGLGAAALTNPIAKKDKESEATSKRIHEEFGALLASAHNLKEGVAQLRTMQESFAAKVSNISAIIHFRNEEAVSIQDVMKHLKELCTKSYDSTTMCCDQVKCKMQQLKAKLR